MTCPACRGANFNWAHRCDHCGALLTAAPPGSPALGPDDVTRPAAAGAADSTTQTAPRCARRAPPESASDWWDGPTYKPGELVDGRLIVESVCRGGMGFVYICRYLTENEARHTPGAARSLFFPNSLYSRMATEYRHAALKSFRPLVWDSDIAERFHYEAQLWLGLPRHPHVVAARSFRRARLGGLGGALLELEYVEGGTLAERLTRGRLDPQEAVRIAGEVCEGMTFLAQTAAIVHRDLKPANILLAGDGTAKISDLGIARAFDVNSQRRRAAMEARLRGLNLSAETLSRVGALVGMDDAIAGSAPYLPPEYWLGDSPPTTRGDIYSFGAVLYEMLTGRRPFVAATVEELRNLHLHEQAASPVDSAGVDAQLSAICLKCLEKQPEQRFGTFADVHTALTTISGVTIGGSSGGRDAAANMTALDHWALSRGRLFQGDSAGALEHARRAVSLAPTSSHLELQIAHVLRARGQDDEARVHEERERSAHPANPEVYLNLALEYGKSGRAADAAAAARTAADIAPDCQTAQEAAFFFTDKQCATDPSLTEDAKRKMYGEAAARLAVQLHIHEGPATPMREWMELACLLGDQQHFTPAIFLHAQCTTRFPNVPTNWYNYAVTCHRAGERDRALACYTNAIALDPTSALALVNRGLLQWQRGDIAAARRDWQDAATVQPNHVASRLFRWFLTMDDQTLATSELRNNIEHWSRFGSLGYHL